ncbi:hypothetical protein, partial [Methanobrevibacter filiformis]|uniref:hypothetical protein n=1 Tax=Methanobrevibacter filiformis TaxID=55758 RepID=UPI000A5FF5AB
MFNNQLITDNNNIVSIQLNLFDYYDNETSFNELVNRKIYEYDDLNLQNDVVMTSPHHFEFNTRRCTKCGKSALIRKKFVSRNIVLNQTGDKTFYFRQYYCNNCGKYPTVKLDNVFEKYKKTSKSLIDNIHSKARTGRKSLRKMSKDLKVDNMSLSHQTVANILDVEEEEELRFNVEEL